MTKGRLIAERTYKAVFAGLLTPRQMQGMGLLLEKTPAARHNGTARRSTASPVGGVSCLDCHVNGHTGGQYTLAPGLRPQADRYRVDTATLRGAFALKRFGSTCLLGLFDFLASKVEAVYFDGDLDLARRAGARRFSDREIEALADAISVIGFPPAPKLGARGEFDPKKATAAEMRGETLFGGKAGCATCHRPPYYTDHRTHDLKVERFYAHVGSARAGQPGRPEGAFKTPSLRGVKDSPPYIHDGQLLTLEVTLEFFNIVLGLKLSKREKAGLVAFLRVL